MTRRKSNLKHRLLSSSSLFLFVCSLLCISLGRWVQNQTNNEGWLQHQLAGSTGASNPAMSRSLLVERVVEEGNEAMSEETIEVEDGKEEEGEGHESKHEAEGEEEVEEEEEEEDESKFEQVDLAVVIVIALFLIVATLAFEAMKEALEESVSEDMEVILEKLFGELTILGFLAIVTFVLTQTGLLEMLSIKVFGESEELLEYFEAVHYTIFFIMVFFVIQVLIMINEASETERQWEEMDAHAKMMTDNNRRSTVTNSQIRQFNKKDTIFALCFPQLRDHKAELTRMHLIFKALREEFLLERSLEPGFQPAPKEQRVEDDFNFGRYLSLAQAFTMTRIVEVEERTWAFFGVAVIVFYAICMAANRDIEVISWIFVGIGWFVFIMNVIFERHLIAVRNKFIPKKFLEGDALQSIQGFTKGFDENTYLIETQSGDDYDLPAWCDVDIELYRKNRNWFTKCLVGGNPNRQQALFVMDSFGPKLYFLILQSNLIFTGVYAGTLLLTFLPYIYKIYIPLPFGWCIFAGYVIFAFLPVLGISYNKKRVVAALAQVSSIGAYRKPQIVSDVLLETKTGRVVRTFLIIHKMWHTARSGCEKTSSEKQIMLEEHKSDSFSALERIEVAKSFDALDADHSGAISHDEFRDLLNRLGAELSDSDFRLMVSALDADGDGEVTKEEFLEWYATQSAADNLTLSERARDLFGMFDRDNSGEITIGEFKAKLDALQMGFSVDEIGAIVNELDRDRNGTVSEEEFEELLQKYYPKELSSMLDHDEEGHSMHGSMHGSHHGSHHGGHGHGHGHH